MTNEHHFVDEDPRMAHIHVEDDYRMQSMGIMAISALWLGCISSSLVVRWIL